MSCGDDGEIVTVEGRTSGEPIVEAVTRVVLEGLEEADTAVIEQFVRTGYEA